jgi:hypothetical protein
MTVNLCLQFANQSLKRSQGFAAEYLDSLQVLECQDDGARIAVDLRYGIVQAHLLVNAYAA